MKIMIHRKKPKMEHVLFAHLMQTQGLTTAMELANFLGVSEAYISRARYGNRTITAEIILRVYDRTGMSIEEIRELIERENDNTRKKS
jgi:plasmid maintenance system antidote protein VapI